MRKIIGTIGATLAIALAATSAETAGAQATGPPGPDSGSADLSLAPRAHDSVRHRARGEGLVAVVSDAPEGLRAKRRDVARRDTAD
jgi:hypothetical protein